MGGSIGRSDALIGAVEAQKAEGVLHLHFFIYLQMAHQFLHLEEIATMIRDRLLSADKVKQFCNHARRATYPDPEAFRKAQQQIEKMASVR